MLLIIVDLAAFVNPCSLHRATSPVSLTAAAKSRDIANSAASGVATRAVNGGANGAANSRLRHFRDPQARIRSDRFTPRTQHSFAQKHVELHHHRITGSA